MSYYISEGLKLNYDIYGSGEPLIIIGGITCNNHHWDLVRDQLSKKFQLILPDNRGIGKSEVPRNDYAIADNAIDIVNLINHLAIPRAHILGHSLGGAVAQYLGAYHSDKVNKLIISHSAIKFNACSIIYFEHMLLLKEAGLSPLIQATSVLPFVFSDEFNRDPKNLEEYLENEKNEEYPQSLKSFKQQFHVLRSADSSSFIQDINVPTLIIAGKTDKLTPKEDSLALLAKIKHAQYKEIHGAHVPMIEAPNDYAELVIDFLSLSQ